jgi:GNAT superfamily N-acetyltransferase
MTSLERTLSLRPVTDDDRPFLLGLYASTRETELNQVVWPPGTREAFIAQQFEAQDRSWRLQSPDARFDLVLVDGRPAGRFYVARTPAEIRIVDISLAPDHRGHGIGTRLLTTVIAESDTKGISLTIHVERFNPALRLYERLGFAQVEDRGVYLFLERRPQPKTA